MAIDIMQPIRISIDLSSGLVQTPLRMQLMKGDKKANRVIVALTDGGKEADLTGVTVTGSFITVPTKVTTISMTRIGLMIDAETAACPRISAPTMLIVEPICEGMRVPASLIK